MTRYAAGALGNDGWYRYYAPRRVASLTAQRMADDRARAERDLDAVLSRTGLSRSDRILAGLRVDLRRQAFRLVRDGPYAAVLSLYDRRVCGFPTEKEDADSLRHIASLLEPGGWLVLGIDDWPGELPEASERWETIRAGRELVEIIPDRVAMTATHRVTLVRPDGRRETHALTRRHYSPPELDRLLTGAGLTTTVVFRRLAEEQPYDESREGLFVYARRT